MQLSRSIRPIALILAAAPALPAQAAVDAGRPVRVGAVGGLSLASVAAENTTGLSHRVGFVFGAQVIIPLARTLSVQPELIFVPKGARSSYGGRDAAIDFDYLELPVLLRVDLPIVRGLTPFAYGGPAMAYQTRCRFTFTQGSTRTEQTCGEYDLQQGGDLERRRVDYAAVAGGGLGLTVAGQRVTLGARYEQGLRSISPQLDTKNRVWSYLATVDWPVR